MEPSRTKPESESQRVEVEWSIDWEIVCLKGERGVLVERGGLRFCVFLMTERKGGE